MRIAHLRIHVKRAIRRIKWLSVFTARGAAVGELPANQRGPGRRDMWVEFVSSLLYTVSSPGTPLFPPPQKPIGDLICVTVPPICAPALKDSPEKD